MGTVNEPKFTKGPLKLREWTDAPDYTTIRIMDAEGIWLGESSSLYSPRLGYRKEEVLANAQLWAAAPDLYAACKAVLCAISNGCELRDSENETPMGVDTITKDLMAAIAKAEGRT